MKKIVIFIITVLVLGVLAMITCVQNSKRIEQEKNKEQVATINSENLVTEKELQSDDTEVKEKQNIGSIVAENMAIAREEPKEEVVEENKAQNNVEVTNKDTQRSKVTETQVKTNAKLNNNVSTTKKEEKPITQQTTISQNTKTEVESTEKKAKTEELKRNDAMITKIKNVIQNNTTEDMRNFGYEIVVDSSIKGLTNQFTYSENRVKNYIRNKFGTIRIYAEDYYCNGEFVMTECYII